MTVFDSEAGLEVIKLSRLTLRFEGAEHFPPFQHEGHAAPPGGVVGHLRDHF